MRYILSPEVFADPENSLALLGVLHRATQQRCYISVHDPYDEVYCLWLQSQERRYRDAWELQLEWSLRDSAAYRIAAASVDRIGESVWEPTVRLTVSDALTMIDTPFRIVVENSRYDRAFLLTMGEPSQRRFIEWLEKHHRLYFYAGGGIGELKKILQDHVATCLGYKLNHWVLIDSDAEAPGSISETARQVIAVCEQLDLRYHCLQRRSIENYLPKGGLYDWVDTLSRSTKIEKRRQLEAYYKMTADQREYYHLKSGFDGMRGWETTALYNKLPDSVTTPLKKGISRNLADIYRENDVTRLRDQVDKENSHLELTASIEKLIEFIRVPYG